MIVRTAQRHLNVRLAAAGLTLADVAGAILPDDGKGGVRVDTEHEAYRSLRKPKVRQTPPSAPAIPARNARTGPQRWAELHQRSSQRVADPVAELAWIAKLADGLESCGCSAHWRKYLASNPPAVDSPALYTQWAVEAHNAVNRRLNKPLWLPPGHVIH